MGLGFLTPVFLLGLAAVAVPILLHLRRRDRSQLQSFPSLMFLHKIPYRSVRRQRIRHWFLLLLRCLVLGFLAFAFARPLLEGSRGRTAGLEGRREVVLLLDHSYSMGYGDRWDRARAAAQRVIQGIGPGDRATLVLFSDRAAARHQPTADPARLQAVLDGARLSSRGTRYAPALKLARKLLLDSDRPRREVVLISDFQRVGWSGDEGVRLPRATVLSTVDLSDREASNVAVTSVVLDRSRSADRERILASARLTNKGSSDFGEVTVALELNDRSHQVTRVRLDANSSQMVSFDPFTLPEGTSLATVRAVADPLEADNAFHFVLSPANVLPVLVVEGAGSRRASSLFLQRALEQGDRPAFRVAIEEASQLTPSILRRHAVVVLNDTAWVHPSLRRFVELGGGLLVALGQQTSSAEGNLGLLPQPSARPVDRSSDWGGTLADLDYSHPVFELFNAPRSGDFSGAKFFRYHRLPDEAVDRILARFDDGTIALGEKDIGAGRMLIWSTSLDTFWNNLALQPVFLPFLHELVKHLAGYTTARHWYTVDEVIDLAFDVPRSLPGGPLASPPSEEGQAQLPFRGRWAAQDLPRRWIVRAPSGEKNTLVLGEGAPLLKVEEQGFYELRPLRAPDGSAEEGYGPVSLAVNLDVTEADLTPLDAEEFASAISPTGTSPTGVETAGAELTPAEKERGQKMWRFLMAAVFLLLAAETVFANRLSGTASERR